MINLNLDWREVLWWMQGGMIGSHLRWSVYEDMVNRVWPQASEQERRNMFLIMRRDFGLYWRPDDWIGYKHMQDKGEGPWNEDIPDETPWMYFRQVLARFNPDNQYAVTMKVRTRDEINDVLGFTQKASLISCPTLYAAKGYAPTFDLKSAPLTVRAYEWKKEYYIDWTRRCDASRITKVEQITIPDDGTM